MDRRKFLVGMGSASIGGSALIGTGAFSRVESQRSVTIQVAEDPAAYLGLDRCATPNSSYVAEEFPNDDGHLAIDMTPDNPTDFGGQGVNSDSRTWFDRVFKICNQGKKQVCVYIQDDENWPTYADGEDEVDGEERRVQFYPEDQREESLIGFDNAVHLPLGDCFCVGLRTTTKGLSDGDELLEELESEITIVADEDDWCKPDEIPPEDIPPEDTEVVDDGETISFIAFVADGKVPDITSVTARQVKNGDEADGDYDPVTVDFEGNTQLKEVIMNIGGPDRDEAGLIFGNGYQSGTATTRDEDADNVEDDWLFVDDVETLVAGQSDDDRSTTDPRHPDDRDDFGFVKFDWKGFDDGGFQETDSREPGE